jgi:hypothetical protein
MKFGILRVKSFQRQFWPILNPLILKIVNFAQNKSSRAEKLANSLFLYGESEKIGPETICRPPRFQVLRIFLTFSLNKKWLNSLIFFKTIDGLLRYGTLENLDKNGLPTVLASSKVNVLKEFATKPF